MLRSSLFCLALCALFFTQKISAEGKIYSYFSPPEKWEPATPEIAASHVKIGFICPKKKGFSPSLNLATEQVGDISPSDYLKAVKEIYERNPQNRWRHLGKIRTKAGESILTEIDTKTEWGDIRLMQMILIENKIAYIVTAAALKEEFGTYTKEFQKAFQSFNLTDDLFAPITEESRKESIKMHIEILRRALAESTLENKKFQNEYWIPFEKKVISEFSDMGKLWQLLLLKDALE